VTHYEVLGVRVDAPTREIRASYLRRARLAHPDFHGEDGPQARATHEADMRALNEAWAVLGDADRRSAYDAALAEVRLDGRTGSADRPTAPRPTGAADPDFVPYDSSDDIDYAALLDARPSNGARLPRAVQLAPAVLLVVAIFSLSAAAVTSLPALVAVGLVSLVLSGVSFVLAPMLAVLRSLDSDRDG
jgi:hypothetical protein